MSLSSFVVRAITISQIQVRPKSNPLRLYRGSDKWIQGLDLMDRVPEELWMEVRNTVQEAVIKIIPKKKKCKKAKWLTDKALKTAEKRQEAKSKRKNKRYTHLNGEFQRIARRDRKPSSVINAKK